MIIPIAGRRHDDASLGDLTLSAARRGGQRPIVTFYGEGTGERTELGHATLLNWASKTANLLADEYDLAPGATLALRQPAHWTSVVVLLAAWRAGVAVHGRDAGGPDADVVVLDEAGLAAMTDPDRTIVVGSGLGGRLLGEAGGAAGFAEAVLGCPDEFDDPAVTGDAVALVGEGATLTHGDLLEAAAALTTELGLVERDRLLLPDAPERPATAAAIVAALATGGSVVLVAGASTEALRERAAAERVTRVVTTAAGGDEPAPPAGGSGWPPVHAVRLARQSPPGSGR